MLDERGDSRPTVPDRLARIGVGHEMRLCNCNIKYDMRLVSKPPESINSFTGNIPRPPRYLTTRPVTYPNQVKSGVKSQRRCILRLLYVAHNFIPFCRLSGGFPRSDPPNCVCPFLLDRRIIFVGQEACRGS